MWLITCVILADVYFYLWIRPSHLVCHSRSHAYSHVYHSYCYSITCHSYSHAYYITCHSFSDAYSLAFHSFRLVDSLTCHSFCHAYSRRVIHTVMHTLSNTHRRHPKSSAHSSSLPSYRSSFSFLFLHARKPVNISPRIPSLPPPPSPVVPPLCLLV